MKNNFILCLKAVMMISVFILTAFKANACKDYQLDLQYNQYPGNLCEGQVVISANSGPHFDYDYIEVQLQTWNGSSWNVQSSYTSDDAIDIGVGNGGCWTIPIEFTVNATWGGVDSYRVRAVTFRRPGPGQAGVQMHDWTTDATQPAVYKKTNLINLYAVDLTNGGSTTSLAPCANSYELLLAKGMGERYDMDFEFNIYESDASGNVQGTIGSLSSSGYDLGEFGSGGTDFNDWFDTDVQNLFQQVIGTYDGFVKLELSVVNNGCTGTTTDIVSRVLEIKTVPYASNFYFLWNEDGNATTSYMGRTDGKEKYIAASQNSGVIPEIGDLSGTLVSDISTSNYDYYEVELFKDFGAGAFNSVGSQTVTGIGGAGFELNPSTISTVPSADKPFNNPGVKYKIYLRIGTAGCSESEYWSYFEVTTACSFCSEHPGNGNNQSTSNLKGIEGTFLSSGSDHVGMGDGSGEHWHGVNQQNSSLTLFLDNADLKTKGELSMKLYSMNQQQVKDYKVQSGYNELALSGLNKGAYIIMVTNSSGQIIYNGKLIR